MKTAYTAVASITLLKKRFQELAERKEEGILTLAFLDDEINAGLPGPKSFNS